MSIGLKKKKAEVVTTGWKTDEEKSVKFSKQGFSYFNVHINHLGPF